MIFSSDKFKQKRELSNDSLIAGGKRTITFNKFITVVKDKITQDPKYEIVAALDHFDVQCDNCLEQTSKVVKMYVVKNVEIEKLIAREKLVSADHPDLVMKCSICYSEKRLIDVRKHHGLNVIEPRATTEQIGLNSGISNVSMGRKQNYEAALSQEALVELNKLKGIKGYNEKAMKEMEQNLKQYNNMVKKFKDTPLEKDYHALISEGLTVVEIENNQV